MNLTTVSSNYTVDLNIKHNKNPTKGIFTHRDFSDSCGYLGHMQQALEPLTGFSPHCKTLKIMLFLPIPLK